MGGGFARWLMGFGVHLSCGIAPAISCGMDNDLHIWRSLFSFFMVIGAMWFVFRWLRRNRGMHGGVERRMKVIERLPIDARRSVLLLSVDDESLVLGVSGEQISLIKTIEAKGQNDES